MVGGKNIISGCVGSSPRTQRPHVDNLEVVVWEPRSCLPPFVLDPLDEREPRNQALREIWFVR